MREAPPAMTVHNFAVYLNVSEKSAGWLIQRRKPPGFKVASTWRVQRGNIGQLVERQKKADGAREVDK